MERFYSIGALSQSMGRPKKGNNVSNVLGIIEDGALEFQDLCEEYIEEFPELLKANKPQLRQVLNDLREYLDTMSEDQTFTDRTAMQVLSEVKGNQVEYVKVPVDSLRSYFRPDTSIKQMTETLVKAMEFYNKHLERQRRDRDAR